MQRWSGFSCSVYQQSRASKILNYQNRFSFRSYIQFEQNKQTVNTNNPFYCQKHKNINLRLNNTLFPWLWKAFSLFSELKRSGNVIWVFLLFWLPSAVRLTTQEGTIHIYALHARRKQKETSNILPQKHVISLFVAIFYICSRWFQCSEGRREEEHFQQLHSSGSVDTIQLDALTTQFCCRFLMSVLTTATVCSVCSFQPDLLALALLLLHSVIRPNRSQMCAIVLGLVFFFGVGMFCSISATILSACCMLRCVLNFV